MVTSPLQLYFAPYKNGLTALLTGSEGGKNVRDTYETVLPSWSATISEYSMTRASYRNDHYDSDLG